MNGIDKITDRITGDADREIAEILKKAKDEAGGILERYEAEADALRRDILGKGKTQADERVLRLADVADLEARKMILAAKQEMLDLVFKKAMSDLLDLPEKDYISLLARLVADSAGTGDGEIIFSQVDRTRFGKKVVAAANEAIKAGGKSANITLSEETRPLAGGLLLKEGDVEINCSFEAIIRSIRDDLIKDVSAVLFA